MPYIIVNDTSLYYQVQGQGVPIMFIHPPLLTSENFDYQAAQLSNRFQVITFDIRGHGSSDRSFEPVTYPLIVQDMLKLMDGLNIKQAYVCGYSTGGGVALHALLTAPERFLGGILVSGMSEASDLYLRLRMTTAIALSRSKLKSLLRLAITWGNADNLKTFRTLYRSSQPGTSDNWYEYYRYSLDYSCTDQLQQIQAPVLLVYGKKDKSFHRYAWKLQQHLQNSKLIWIPEAKHQIPTKNAIMLNDCIESWITDKETRAEKIDTTIYE